MARYYRDNVTVAASMRGHGVMIPFGLHTPTISLVSHDKVLSFATDVGLADTAVEIAPSVRARSASLAKVLSILICIYIYMYIYIYICIYLYIYIYI